MHLGFVALLILISLPLGLSAGEIAAGSMLGPRYDAKSFYHRPLSRGDWRKTYDVGPFRKQARGKLLGLRTSYGLFQDRWLDDPEFNADANTDSLIAALKRYKSYGLNVISVSLQGGHEPYSAAGETPRTGQARDGEEGGALISAFAADGSLDEEWARRLARLLEAADQNGIFIVLTYFTPDQDEIFESPEAIVAAARNMTRWLIEHDARNVIIDLADRWDIESEIWDFGRFIPRNIGSLVLDVRDQFNSAAFTLPIGATGGNDLTYPSSLAKICDVILVRAGERTAAQRVMPLDQLQEADRPVVLFGADPLAAAAADRAAGAVFAAPAGTAQFPFEYGAGEADQVFLPLLDSVAGLALKKPPKHEPVAR